MYVYIYMYIYIYPTIVGKFIIVISHTCAVCSTPTSDVVALGPVQQSGLEQIRLALSCVCRNLNI
jgi:hypothetical protein